VVKVERAGRRLDIIEALKGSCGSPPAPGRVPGLIDAVSWLVNDP